MKRRGSAKVWIPFILGLLIMGGASDILAKEEVVHIGCIMPLTGGAAFFGTDATHAILLAADEINAAGGITVAGKKYKIKIETYDDEATPAKGVSGLKKLKDLYDIPVVIANVSGTALAIMEINEKLGILWCGLSKHPDITNKGNKLVLRSLEAASRDTDLLAEGALEILKAKSFAALSDTGDYGRNSTDMFSATMKARGATYQGAEWFDMRKDTDFRVQITKIKAKNPDTVFIAAYDEATAQVIKQCRELGLTVPLVLTVGFQQKGEEITGPKNIEGCLSIYSITRWDPEPKAVTNYKANYLKRFKTQPASYGQNNYELLYIIARGMEKAGTVTDALKIRAGMRAAVPVEEEHRTYAIRIFTDNGDAISERSIGIYRNGKLVKAK
jgi:branched-chain amino acid transport system substrate-binding protein